jgi:hypothetical protein
MATPSPPTRPLPLHLPHKHTLAQGSFGRSSIVRPPVLSLFVRSSDRPIIRPFDHSIVHRSFIVPIHRSFIVTIHRSSFVHTNYLPSLFIVTIHHHYSSLLFIDHLITPNFNYSSVMLSSPPKTSQTHIPVIRTPVTVIFLPVGNFLSGHPSQISPS